MTRLSRGDLSIELSLGESLASGIAMLDAIASSDARRAEHRRRQRLHAIGPDYVCSRCGMTAIDIARVPYGGAECEP